MASWVNLRIAVTDVKSLYYFIYLGGYSTVVIFVIRSLLLYLYLCEQNLISMCCQFYCTVFLVGPARIIQINICIAYIQYLFMSFFNKLFGGSDKNQKPKGPPPTAKPKEDTTDAKKLKIQAACVTLDNKINEFEDKEKKFQHKIDLLKKKAKELLEADKKKDAKKYAEEATRVQKQMESYTLRKKALIDKKFQLEQAMMDMDTIDAIEGAQTHIKNQQKYSEKLEDLILDGQQAKMQQQQINDKLKDLVGNESEDEEVDNMLDDLMKEINMDKKKKIENNKNVNVNVPQTQTQKQTTKQAKQEEDDIAKMLADLG